METYPVGAFFCATVTGRVGFLIGIAQALCGRPSRYGHAGIIVTADGQTVEAQPGGARPDNLANYPGRVLICDGPILRELGNLDQPLRAVHEAFLRQRVVDTARSLIGTPYSIADYFALALLHLRLPSTWVRQRVESSGHLICSALCDRAFQRAGIHLFTGDPKRLSGDVMPSDLADWADEWEEAHR